MAASTHNPSRRALLGAAVALPLLGARAANSLPSLPRKRESSLQPESGPVKWIPDQVRHDGSWWRALAAFEQAEAELHAFERRQAAAPEAEQMALDRLYDDRLGALYHALRRLLRLRAPDAEALLTKIALVTDHEVATLTGGEACMATLKRDAQRLEAGLVAYMIRI
jgi:hypothetical protein